MKCGTTLLSNYFSKNPKIKINKGDSHLFLKNNSKTINHKINELYSEKTFNIDKSASYSLMIKDFSKFYNHNENAKYIWIVRDPVKRAFSNYVHAINRGLEKKSFIECFMYDKKFTDMPTTKNYFLRSKYKFQIKNLLSHVNKKNIHFIVFEDFISNPISVLNDIYTFLGLDNYNHQIIKNEKKRNKSYTSKIYFIYPWIRKIFGKKLVVFINSKFHFKNNLSLKINKTEKKMLSNFYEEDMSFLIQNFNLDLSSWNSYE